MQITVVRAHFGEHTEAFKENGYVGIGWFEPPLPPERDRQSLYERYAQVFPNHPKGTASQSVGQIYRFLNEIRSGHLVITPYNDGRLLVGTVSGAPYASDDDTSPYAYRIPVAWRAEPIDRRALSIPLQNTLKSSLTVFSVKQVSDFCEAIGMPYEKETEASASAAEARPTTYAAIKKHLLALNADEFEQLVSYVLQTLGFEATQETGRTGDGGVDFEGELRVMGVASVQLQVQVKRYASTRINERSIRSFRGALKRDAQGCFITLSEFSKKARASASDPNKVPINLINGRQFVEIMTEQYEHMIELIRAEDNDDLADKLRFRKTLIPA